MTGEKRLLLICGGLRFGDTLHVLPYLNKAKEEGFVVDWLHGSYASGLVGYLKSCPSLPIDRTFCFDDGIPEDFLSVRKFSELFKDKFFLAKSYEYIEANPAIVAAVDVVKARRGVDDVKGDVLTCSRLRGSFLKAVEKVPLRELPEKYIAMQVATWSAWKLIDSLFTFHSPLPIVLLGMQHEKGRVGTEVVDMRGSSWAEIAYIINRAQLFVGVHSVLTVLSFYLGQKTIACHFMEGLFEFGAIHSNCVDMVNPDRTNLEAAVDHMLNSRTIGELYGT